MTSAIKPATELIDELNIAIRKLTPEEIDGEIGRDLLSFKTQYGQCMHAASNPFPEDGSQQDALTDAYELLTTMHGRITGLAAERVTA